MRHEAPRGEQNFGEHSTGNTGDVAEAIVGERGAPAEGIGRGGEEVGAGLALPGVVCCTGRLTARSSLTRPPEEKIAKPTITLQKSASFVFA